MSAADKRLKTKADKRMKTKAEKRMKAKEGVSEIHDTSSFFYFIKVFSSSKFFLHGFYFSKACKS